jgi:hypothetical protein
LTLYGLEAEVEFIDIVPPAVTLLSDLVYLPGIVEFSSNEDGVAYLVNTDTLDTVDEIRTDCLDSLEVTAGVPLSFDLADYHGPELWIQAADASLNLSETAGFAVAGVGIETDPELSVAIYPNPARDMITVSCNLNAVYSVEIADINGRIIFACNHNAPSLSIDLREFRNGLYFLRVSDGRSTLTRKLIKQ